MKQPGAEFGYGNGLLLLGSSERLVMKTIDKKKHQRQQQQ